MSNYYRGLCFSQDFIDEHNGKENCYDTIMNNIVKEHSEIFKNWLGLFTSLNRFLPERIFSLHFAISQKNSYTIKTNLRELYSFLEQYENLLVNNNINDNTMYKLLNEFSYITGALSKEEITNHFYIIDQLDDLIRPIVFPKEE